MISLMALQKAHMLVALPSPIIDLFRDYIQYLFVKGYLLSA